MKIPNYGTPEGLLLVVLFALAMGGFLWVAWSPGKLTPKRIAYTMSFFALALIDMAFIIINKP